MVAFRISSIHPNLTLCMLARNRSTPKHSRKCYGINSGSLTCMIRYANGAWSTYIHTVYLQEAAGAVLQDGAAHGRLDEEEGDGEIEEVPA